MLSCVAWHTVPAYVHHASRSSAAGQVSHVDLGATHRPSIATVVHVWSPLTELNCRPSPYHGDALPTELRGRVGCRFHSAAWRDPGNLVI